MTIAKLYENHKNGKVSKQSFLNEARKDNNLPWVNNLTSYEDAVKILKNKGVISEGSMTDLSGVGASGPGPNTIRKQGTAYSSNAEVPYNEKEVLATVKEYLDNNYSYEEAIEYAAERHGLDSDELTFNPTFSKDAIDTEGHEPLDEDNVQSLNEAHDLTTTQIIDRLNPYQFNRAVEFEMAKLKVLDNISYEKVKEKVAKKMAKDPQAYRYTQLANAKQIEKDDNRLAMKPVKGDNFVDKDNEMKKIKGHADEKKNTSTPKTENRKGKPKGVKEMKGSKKKPAGVKEVMKQDSKETVLNEMMEFFKKKDRLKENTATPAHRTDYNKGTRIKTPEGEATVTEVIGSVIYYELEGGIEGSKTLNVIDRINSKNMSPEDMKKAQDIKDKEERDEKWKNWDKRGEKTFGGELPYQPEDIHSLMKKLKAITEKLKLKKEAKKFKAGGETIFKSDAEAAGYETDLKKAKVQYTKTNV